jgi:hypothetical protein
MTTLLQAIELAKKDVEQGYLLAYYVHDGNLYHVTDQGEYKAFPMPSGLTFAGWAEDYYD